MFGQHIQLMSIDTRTDILSQTYAEQSVYLSAGFANSAYVVVTLLQLRQSIYITCIFDCIAVFSVGVEMDSKNIISESIVRKLN